MNDAIDKLLEKLSGWLDSAVLMLPNLVAAIAAFFGAILVARLVSVGVYRFMERVSKHRSLNQLARKFVRLLGIVIGFIIALQILDLEKAASTFLAGAGLVGLALGFAFQDLSANFISGVAMAIRRPVRVGDLVETNDVLGIVEELELRSLVVRSLEGNSKRIPNRKVYENTITNYSSFNSRRVDVEVGVSYGDDLELAKRAVREAIDGLDCERVAHKDTEVFFTEFGGSSINMVGRFWIPFSNKQAEYLAARSQAIVAVKAAFDEHGLTIPFPIRTLDFGIVGGETLHQHLANGRASTEGESNDTAQAAAPVQ